MPRDGGSPQMAAGSETVTLHMPQLEAPLCALGPEKRLGFVACLAEMNPHLDSPTENTSSHLQSPNTEEVVEGHVAEESTQQSLPLKSDDDQAKPPDA